MTGKELEQIYQEAYKAVYWTAMALLKNEADAEDIVQDTFVSFIESYSDITDTSKATALLKKIAANKCLNRIKLAKTDAVEDEFFDNVEAVPEDFLPDSIVESADMRRIVMDIINNSLSEDVRRTLILFYFDEMSTKEIASGLGVPQGTVLRRLNFARNKIKKEVEKYEKENDTKLFVMAIPFLTKLFTKESEQVAFKPMPASLANLSASVKAPSKGAGLKASSGAIRKGTDIMKTKILIGCIAGVAAVGVTVGIIAGVVTKTGNSKGGDIMSKVVEEESGAANKNGSSGEVSNSQETSGEASGNVTTTKETVEIYSLEGMSAQEIFDLLLTFSADISTGSNLDNYSDRFSVKPNFDLPDAYDSSEELINYSFNSGRYYSDTCRDYIQTITIENIERKADGTVVVSDQTCVTVDLFLSDRDTAAALFDLVYDYYCKQFPPNTFYSKSDREGEKFWHAYANYNAGEIELWESMNDIKGLYNLCIHIPVG